MKKLFLCIFAVSLLYFISFARPVSAMGSTGSLPDSRLPVQQHIMLQNIFKFFKSFNAHSSEKAADKTALEASSTLSAPALKPRENSSRGFRSGDIQDRGDALSLYGLEQEENVSAFDFSAPSAGEAPQQAEPAETPVPTPAPTPEVDPVTKKIDSLIQEAKKYQGVKYVWGGTSPSGFDCSGYVYYLYQNIGMSLPRVSYSQYNTGESISKNQLRAGDLVFFSTYGSGASHVGVYIGDGNFIHASSGAKKVTISTLSSGFYSSCYLGARRVIK